MKEKETRIKDLGKEVVNACVVFGKAFWSILKKIGLLLNECYTWLAYVRMKGPRTSLTIELALFISVSFLYMMSCYIDKVTVRDRTAKKLYDMEVEYTNSIIKAEISGYNRGLLEANNKATVCYEKEQTYEEQ